MGSVLVVPKWTTGLSGSYQKSPFTCWNWRRFQSCRSPDSSKGIHQRESTWAWRHTSRGAYMWRDPIWSQVSSCSVEHSGERAKSCKTEDILQASTSAKGRETVWTVSLCQPPEILSRMVPDSLNNYVIENVYPLSQRGFCKARDTTDMRLTYR